jgi:isopenicillin-N N-acyltransferase like protein
MEALCRLSYSSDPAMVAAASPMPAPARGRFGAVELVVAEGPAFERGLTIGRAMAGSIEPSMAFNRRYVEAHGLDASTLERILTPYVEASEDAFPHLVEELRGMAEGAGVPFLDVFFANAFEEVYGIVELSTPSPVPLERCTDVVLRAPGRTLLGHTEQWYAGDEGSPVVVLDIPDEGPAMLAPVVSGSLPLNGINEHGVAVGAMSLSATDERLGVPRSLVCRDVLDARDRDDLIARATRSGRAGGYSYLAAFPGGDAFVLETTATAEAIVDVDVHTNHALDPGVAAVACAAADGSQSRLGRARALASEADATVEGMRAILGDHGADGQNICAHPDPTEGDEGSTILFAMICESETRSLWVAPGHACTARFESYSIPL